MKRLTTQEFIDKATSIHSNRYDYSESVYVNSRTKVQVLCKEHGPFDIIPTKHLTGQKCYSCSKQDAAIKLSTNIDDFIKKSNKLHNDKYDYSLVKNITNQFSRVRIICPKHGEFEQTVKSHRKRGCRKCSLEINSGWTTADWIRKVDNGKLLKLYYIKCWNRHELFYKIGLTCKDRIEDRFHGKDKMPYNYDILHVFTGSVEELVKKERMFKQKILKLKDLYVPELKFNGSTYECFKGGFTPKFI